MTRTPMTSTSRVVAVVALLTASACTKSQDAAPQPTPREQAQAVQRSLALPADAAAAMQTPTDAAVVAIAAAPSVPSTARSDASVSMLRVLGVPPTLIATSRSLHQGAAPHLFHLGATSFFLDHDELALTAEQRSKLSGIRETAMLDYATKQRAIDHAEQELWSITSAEHPSASQVEAKLTEIARLATRQRMDHILAIGRAVAELTDAQHGLLATPAAAGLGAMPMPPGVTPTSANGSATDPTAMPADPPPKMPMGASGSAMPMGHM